MLRYLLERAGEVVTREELKEKLWSADTFVDFDDGLNTAVKKLRDALGDSADRPQYIETLPRRGYRFIGTLQQEAAISEPTHSETVPMAPPLVAADQIQISRRPRRRVAIGLGLIVALLVGLTVFRNLAAVEPMAIRSIVVLPLEDLSGKPDEDYFVLGLTDALATEIARTVGNSLEVKSSPSAASYRDKSPEQIAKELDVDAVIQGAVVRSGNRARITAQLINMRVNKSLWAHSYNEDLRDILGVQSQIAAAIAREVELKLSPEAQARLASPMPVDPRAYDLYQRGRYNAYNNNTNELSEAMELLEESVLIDPNFAPAHATLARVYSSQVFWSSPQASQLELKAIEEVNYALKLDPDLAEAYLVRGIIYWTHRNGFPHERAIGEVQHALKLNQNLAEAHHHLATIYIHIGLLDKAESALRTALRLDPANIGLLYRMAVNLLDQGRLQEALKALEGTKRYSPELWEYQMALVLFKLGRKEDSAAQIRDYLRTNPRDRGGVGNAMQALLFADAGQPALATRSIRAAIEKGKDFGHFHHAAYAIGTAYAVMKQPKDAVRWLRAAAEDGFPCYPFYESDPTLESLRSDPAFVEFMNAMRSDWERRKATL